ncbi:E3 ubiquitin-protein ligase Mdm2-like isoform X2 [Cimex lectularius]|uniref:Uncharacterized protein n=1 Tax=Cimex lectularius TaxID=79782 RepID=A0A8I6TMP6_CIMLE|nr:E3 ubiquitin-protein ligase Mdm2-like isoform X2 [Cimex lectularius]
MHSTSSCDDCTKDSSDLTDSSAYEEHGIEFEVVSMSEGERFYRFDDKFSSSSPEDVRNVMTRLNPKIIEVEDSESKQSGGDCVTEPTKVCCPAPYKFCIRCRDINHHPYFPYCIRCQRLRRDFLPKRPGRKKKRGKLLTVLSPDSVLKDEVIVQSFDSPKSDSLCNVCGLRPKNGGFIHGLIVHLYACYKCALKIYKDNKFCPSCNLKIKAVMNVL